MEAALGRRELLSLLSLLLPPLAAALLGPAAPLGQEAVRVGVMMLDTSGEFHKGQVLFNITYVNGQVYLNDFPMKSGVSHITCQTIIETTYSDVVVRSFLAPTSPLEVPPDVSSGSVSLAPVNVVGVEQSDTWQKLGTQGASAAWHLRGFGPLVHACCSKSENIQQPVENRSLDNSPDQQRLGTVGVRIMVHEWPLASTSDLQLIVVQEEVTEIDGKQVQQEEVTEIDILVKDLRVLRHSNYTVPLKESMLYSLPRDNDVLFTLPNLSGKDIQDPLQTTSQYLIQQVETTVDEETLPGKLPETPLRIEPPSSYKVMCQWVEDLRKRLCRFWFQSLPILFSFMEVVVVGVVGAALIIKVLKVILPSCEKKGILLLDQVSFVPVTTISLPSDLPDKKNDLDEKACT